MPVSQKDLQPSSKGFTKQDFLDGKCTKDGLPLKKDLAGSPVGEDSPPISDTPPVIEPTVPANDQSDVPVGDEAPASGEALPEQPTTTSEAPKEGE